MKHQLMKPERGAAALVVAISMLVLMGFAALVVDIGAGFNERAQDQSAADAASLAALLEMRKLPPGWTAAEAGAAEVIVIVASNLADSPGAAPDAQAWATCADPEHLTKTPSDFGSPVLGVSDTGQCFSFSENMQRVRVRIPTVDVGTTFGNAIGFAAVPVSAFAESGNLGGASGDVLPFGLGPSEDSQAGACLKAFSNPKSLPGGAPATPCEVDKGTGDNGGNFGNLDISLYGAEKTITIGGTTEQFVTPFVCDSAKAQGKIVANASVGTDHLLAIWDGERRLDSDGCGKVGPNQVSNVNYNADVLREQDGVGSALDLGIIDGATVAGTVFYGRLNRSPDPLFGWDSVPLRCVGNGEYKNKEPNSVDCKGNSSKKNTILLDNVPLWEFWSSGTGACSSVSKTDEMTACLNALWKGTATLGLSKDTDGLADNGIYDIQRTPRFAWVPVFDTDLNSNDLDLGNDEHKIVDFRAVYLTTLMFGCSANDCNLIWNAGDDSVSVYSTGACSPSPDHWCESTLDALGAFLIPDSALPTEVVTQKPGADGVNALRLTR